MWPRGARSPPRAWRLAPGEDWLFVVGDALDDAAAGDAAELVDDRCGGCMQVASEQRKLDDRGIGFRDRDEPRLHVQVGQRYLMYLRDLARGASQLANGPAQQTTGVIMYPERVT